MTKENFLKRLEEDLCEHCLNAPRLIEVGDSRFVGEPMFPSTSTPGRPGPEWISRQVAARSRKPSARRFFAALRSLSITDPHCGQ